MSSLPLSVYNSVIAPEPQAVVRGYATAAVLLMLVLTLFVIARVLARPPSAKPSAGASPPALARAGTTPRPRGRVRRSIPRHRGAHVNRRPSRPAALGAAALTLGMMVMFAVAPAGASPEYAEIEGSGSTWA